ncbi:uncharacterized protein IL334_004682 [Kwoniella shivajii]|uniref:2,4-dienoyl-CoA reductase n=1 Tax=Kwoniella shivajii TaxID=564305 RepID=A0ABZ1D1D7_9TREE|nr:hypothetical protein IL334_004682 [Kwoniella shivajii]
MISIDFKGKVALVTGGGRGIGLAITRALAEAGATVVITYTSKDPSSVAESVSKEFKSPVHVYHCPAEDSSRNNELIQKISQDVGEIDYVIANAGVSLWREAIDMTDEELDKIMQINLFSPYYLSRAIVRHWLDLPIAISSESKERGKRDEKLNLGKKIIFISSISGLVAMTPQAQSAYNASKAGLTMFAKSLAGEWAKYGITVNTISPGYIATDMIANPPPGEELWVQKWHDMTPVDRFGEAKEVGDSVVMMCADRGLGAGFMTGSDLVIDGGYNIY